MCVACSLACLALPSTVSSESWWRGAWKTTSSDSRIQGAGRSSSGERVEGWIAAERKLLANQRSEEEMVRGGDVPGLGGAV